MRGGSSRGVGIVRVRVRVRLLNSLELVLEEVLMSGERASKDLGIEFGFKSHSLPAPVLTPLPAP